jgi:hypothetical protein
VGTGFHGIVDVIAVPVVGLFLYGVNCILQQTGVVVVKRCFDTFELLAR